MSRAQHLLLGAAVVAGPSGSSSGSRRRLETSKVLTEGKIMKKELPQSRNEWIRQKSAKVGLELRNFSGEALHVLHRGLLFAR